jgi:sigma-E factor negative regulatory protein RseB
VRPLRLAALLFGLLGSAAAAPADEGAAAILDRMHRSAEHVAFEGTLVYLHGHDLAALRVSHRTGAGGVGESLFALTGPVRALARHAGGVTCMLPDSAPLTVRRPAAAGGLLGGLLLDFSALSSHYAVARHGVFRIAGRETDVVSVMAKDAYRYGYRFYVDQASGLPLKVDLLAHDRVPIQQIMFTDIDIDPAAAPPAAGLPPARPTPAASGDGDWEPRRLPSGFAVISRADFERDDGATVRQLVVSDGLASFSIYAEPPATGVLRGESQLGAVSAAGGRIGEHHVTVVGEVPLATVRFVLDGMAAALD